MEMDTAHIGYNNHKLDGMLSRTFKNFDQLGDLSIMDTSIQDNRQMDETYNNLLNFQSGKDLQNIK
jgi:hypothetical protein